MNDDVEHAQEQEDEDAELERNYELERAAAEAARVRNAEYMLSIASYPPQKLRERIESMERENAELRARRDDALFELAQIKASNEDHARQIGGVITTAIENATFPLDERLRAAEVQLVELADLRARLARYETPGPVLIQEAHGARCAGGGCDDGDCDCGAYEMNRVYREQYARCTAAFTALICALWPLAKRSIDIAGYSGASGDHPLQDAVSTFDRLDDGAKKLLVELTSKPIPDRVLDAERRERADVENEVLAKELFEAPCWGCRPLCGETPCTCACHKPKEGKEGA